MHQTLTHLGLGPADELVRHHQLEDFQAVSPAQRQQLVTGGKGIGMGNARAGIASFVLVAAYDEAASDRVVVVFAQNVAIGGQRSEAHAIRVPRQPLVVHEQQLHRLVETNRTLAQQVDPPAGADALHGGLDAVGIDCFGLSAFQADQHGAIGAVARSGERERSIQPHGDLCRRLEQPIALQAQDEFARRAHRAHGMGAGGADADLEDVKYAQCHDFNPGPAGGAARVADACPDAPWGVVSVPQRPSCAPRTPRHARDSRLSHHNSAGPRSRVRAALVA